MPFRYENASPRLTGTIADLMLRRGDIAARAAESIAAANAHAAEVSGNAYAGAAQGIGQSIAALPQQIQRQKLAGQQSDEAALDLQAKQRAADATKALSAVMTETPKLSEDGVSVWDVPTITRTLADKGFGPEAGAAAQHLDGINNAFRQARAAQKALVMTGAQSVAAAGNDPTLADHFLDQMAANQLMPAADVTKYREFLKADPANTAKLTAYLMGPQKGMVVPEGGTVVNPVTNAPTFTAPPKPQRPVVVAPGSIAVDPSTGATVATGPAKEATPKSYQHVDKLLDGKPATLLLDPAPGGKLYDLSGNEIDDAASRVKPIPPASVQINNQAAAGSKQEASAAEKAIGDYKVPGPSPRSMSTPAGKAQMDRILAYNPDYDASQFPARQKMRIQFSSGQQSQTINSINTAIGHLDQFVDVAKALGNGDFRPGNQAFNWLKATFGDSAPTNFEGIRSIMSGELASAFKKSGATDQEIKSVEQAIASKNSTTQLVDYATKIAIPALGAKISAFDQQYKQVMGAKDPFKVLTPDAEEVLLKYGFDPAHPRMGGGPAQLQPGMSHVVEQGGVRYRVVTDAAGKVISSEVVK